MKTFVVILLFGLFGATAFAQHAFTPEEITEGARLYQSNCTGCHGTAGDLVPGVSLMSGKFRRATSDDEAAGIIRKGVSGTAMQAFNFSEQQAGMIVAYLRSFSPSSTASLGADAGTAGDAARGKQVFEGKGACLTCHRVGETVPVSGRTSVPPACPDLHWRDSSGLALLLRRRRRRRSGRSFNAICSIPIPKLRRAIECSAQSIAMAL